MFKRYGELMLRMEELGAKAGQLSNGDRHELQSLLEEQAWLGTTMIKKARSILEEIDSDFEKLFDWMIDISDLIDRAASEEGTPADLLELEKVMADAVSLRDQMKRLNLDQRVTRAGKRRGSSLPQEARLEAAPAVAPVCAVETEATFVDVKEPGALPPVDNLPGTDDTPVKPTAVPVSMDPPVVRDSLAVVSLSTGEALQQKSRKKKAKKARSINCEQYRPPRELLASMAEKMAPDAKRKYQPGLPGDVDYIFNFNIPSFNNSRWCK
ncbi:hypothetical protein [Desulfallas thermosapovorans]|nr:hypothetical protein [Desulfallas thermosapovorans]